MCDAMKIDVPDLDTVPICRELGMTMEAIMSRDQRTTSHRVLERDGKACGGSSSSYHKLIGANSESIKSSTAVRKLEIARTIATGNHPSIDELTDLTKARKQKTDIEKKFLLCGVCPAGCNCRNGATRLGRHGCNKNNSNRRTTSILCKKHSTTWLRLGSLLLTLLVVSVQGAPTTMAPEDPRMNSQPKWVNPCGLANDDTNSETFVQISDAQLLGQVILQANTALDHALLFRDDYIRRTFHSDFANLHSEWKHNHYDWLPGPKDIPKELGEPLPNEYIAKLEVRMLDMALLNAYEYLQRYAVGLEQIVWDQEDQKLEFYKQFKDTELQLRTVLCELQVALVERGVTQRSDVTRAAMPSEYRSLLAVDTYRKIRDWLIFRDYMNGLEYVVQVFKHLLKMLKS